MADVVFSSSEHLTNLFAPKMAMMGARSSEFTLLPTQAVWFCDDVVMTKRGQVLQKISILWNLSAEMVKGIDDNGGIVED